MPNDWKVDVELHILSNLRDGNKLPNLPLKTFLCPNEKRLTLEHRKTWTHLSSQFRDGCGNYRRKCSTFVAQNEQKLGCPFVPRRTVSGGRVRSPPSQPFVTAPPGVAAHGRARHRAVTASVTAVTGRVTAPAVWRQARGPGVTPCVTPAHAIRGRAAAANWRKDGC